MQTTANSYVLLRLRNRVGGLERGHEGGKVGRVVAAAGDAAFVDGVNPAASAPPLTRLRVEIQARQTLVFALKCKPRR